MTPMKSERFRLLHIISILLLILSIEATTSSRSITTSSTPSAFPGRKKIQTKLSLLVDDDDDHRKCCDFTKKKSWNAPSTTFLLSLRGGSDEEEKEDESSSLSTGIDTSVVLNKVADVSKKALVILGKATMATAKAFQRAIQAGLQGDDKVADDDDDEEEPVGVATKVFKALKRMIKAAFTFPTEDDDDDDDATFGDVSVEGDESESGEDSEDAGETSAGSKPRADFGSFLANSYGVVDGRDEFGPPVLGGTLSDALQTARSQARLLVVYTPMARPSKNKKSKDHLAIQSILSSDVAAASNKRARKGGEDSGSFLFWGARSGSSEATSAIKRLKAKVTSSKGEKRPILSVVYPAQKIDSTGVPKIVPKVIAQHHCSPPPNASLMAEWLNALRKRHSKQYSTMQNELKEIQYFKERKEGYRDSVKNDVERKEREKEEEAKRLAEEKAEKERQEAIEKRRKELKSALPEEDTSAKAKKIAVRFADGRSGQRRFSPDQPLSVVLSWVDAEYEIEREQVILTTMNGQKTFTWDDETNDKTLEELGLGKMTGLRVTEKQKEQSENSETEPSQ